MICDYIVCLIKLGFIKFFFINGYGGNIFILRVVFLEIYVYLVDFNIVNVD